MTGLERSRLRALALEARERAYSPYSGFSVGAALLCKSGAVYTGCNIENASFSPTVCAERVAFFKAISDGETEFKAICVAGGKTNALAMPTAPCGVCRQVMAEFCGQDFEILLAGEKDEKLITLAELLPFSFGPGDIR